MTPKELLSTFSSYLKGVKIPRAPQTTHYSRGLIGLLGTDRNLPIHTPQGFIRIVESH